VENGYSPCLPRSLWVAYGRSRYIEGLRISLFFRSAWSGLTPANGLQKPKQRVEDEALSTLLAFHVLFPNILFRLSKNSWGAICVFFAYGTPPLLMGLCFLPSLATMGSSIVRGPNPPGHTYKPGRPIAHLPRPRSNKQEWAHTQSCKEWVRVFGPSGPAKPGAKCSWYQKIPKKKVPKG